MDDFFYDAARQHIHAELTSSICESKGLILLTGERGVGKTIALRHLAEELEIVHGVVTLPPSGVLSCEDSLTFGEIVRVCRSRSIAQYDGADDEDDKSGLAELLESCKKADAPVALILDAADRLPLEALVHLSAVSALSADERGRLSIVLSGCLDAPNGLSCSAFEAARLNADVSLRLQRFQDRDVEPYICHRIRLTGRKGPEPFAPSAIDRIIHYSGGNPLSINWICSSALVFASRKAVKTVSAETIDAVAAGGLRGTTADSFSDSGKRADHNSNLESPLFLKGDETDFPNDQSHPIVSVLDENALSAEDEGDKFHFAGETVGDAGRTTEIAALGRFPNPSPLEEFAQEEPVGWWSQDRIGIVLRFVWVFLLTTLVAGVGGVYLSQTERFDAIEFSKRWLALISGNESTLPRNVPRGRGIVDGRPSHPVEASSKLDREYSLETESPSPSGKARQFSEVQRQAIEKPLQVSGSPVEVGSEARSDEVFRGTSLLVASGSTEALDAAIEKAEPDRESKPVTETNEPINRPQLAVTTNSGVEIDKTIKITGSPIEIELPIRPDADEAGGDREVVQESRSATELGEAAERGEVATEAGSAVEADPPTSSEVVPVAAASEAVPAEMEKTAETGEMVESGEVATEAGLAMEADPPASSELVPVAAATTTRIGEMVDRGEVATEAGSAVEAGPPASSEVVPVEMEKTAEIGEMVESGEVAIEAGSAAKADLPAASGVVPAEMETAAGTGEMFESGEVATEAGSPAEADPPLSSEVVPVAAATEAMPAEMETVVETGEVIERSAVSAEAGSPAEAHIPAKSETVSVATATATGTGETVESGEVAIEAGAATEGDQPAASGPVPGEMETAAGTEEAIEAPAVAVEAEADAGTIKVMEAPAFPVETRTEVGSEEAPARFGVLAKAESRPGTDPTVEISDIPADKIGNENDAQGRSTESDAEARASDVASTGAGPAASGPLPPGENTQGEAKSPDFEASSELQQIRRGGVAVQGDGNAEASKRGEGKDAVLAAQLDRPSAEPSESAVNDDRAANLRPVPAAGDAREVSVPVTARVDPPKLRDLPQGRPEPQPTEPEVLAPGEPPTPFHVAETTQPQFDVDRLLDRGDQLLALGDVASARLFYRLAAKKGSAKGAMAMGSTYDPVYLERIGFVGARPNPAEAIKWYRQAIDMGDRGAEVQLRELANRLERAAALGDGEAQRILEGAGN
jgi:type II secretory pathway predicted ATPase ExeA